MSWVYIILLVMVLVPILAGRSIIAKSLGVILIATLIFMVLFKLTMFFSFEFPFFYFVIFGGMITIYVLLLALGIRSASVDVKDQAPFREAYEALKNQFDLGRWKSMTFSEYAGASMMIVGIFAIGFLVLYILTPQ